MSTFKRLLPAPPQVRMHGELINQLMVMIPAQSHNITIIEPIYRQEIQRNKMENNSYYRNIQFTNLTDKPPNLTEDIEMISNNMKFISFSQSPFYHQLEIQVQLLYRSQHQSQIITISSPIWLTLMIITNTPIWENMKM